MFLQGLSVTIGDEGTVQLDKIFLTMEKYETHMLIKSEKNLFEMNWMRNNLYVTYFDISAELSFDFGSLISKWPDILT